MIRLAALLAVIAVSFPALGDEQSHEIAVDANAAFTHTNEVDVDVRYTFRPVGLEKKDEVIPLLRTFVRAPIEVFVHGRRQTLIDDSITGLYLGGRLPLLDGRLYGLADVGGEYVSVNNDIGDENAYFGGRVELELGGRPLELLELGASYVVRPVLSPQPGNVAGVVSRTERDGQVQELAGVVSFATPTDRILFKLRAGYRMTDWDYSGPFHGAVTAHGPFAHAELDVQTSSRFSLVFRGDVVLASWNNERQSVEPFLLYGPQRDTYMWQAEVGLIYWFEGHWGFRAALGGGYAEGPSEPNPIGTDLSDSPRIRLGVGFTSRW